MASNARHAAWQTERRFAVKLYPVDGSQTELACDLTEFLDAVDFAFEWLNSEDPARNGTATLAIVETHDGVSEEVWTYPPAPSSSGELVNRLGFNPVTWAGTPDYSVAEHKSRLRERVASTAARQPLPPPLPETPVRAPVVEQAPAPRPSLSLPRSAPTRVRASVPVDAHVAARKWIRTNARIAWDDRLSRVLLILAGTTLWFTIGLADPTFLVPLAIFVGGLWWRHEHRPPPAADADHEWL
ncbi:MAG TPA: hypothetical protein VIG35_09525 [Gaiellaceae bacterium]|jgi:hypothetical protein